MSENLPEYKELDSRHNDGITVQLLWSPDTDETVILVEDEKADKRLQYSIVGEKALEAFNHPFAFAPPEEPEK